MSAPIPADHSNSIRKVYELGLKTLEAGDTEQAEMICRRALETCEQDPTPVDGNVANKKTGPDGPVFVNQLAVARYFPKLYATRKPYSRGRLMV